MVNMTKELETTFSSVPSTHSEVRRTVNLSTGSTYLATKPTNGQPSKVMPTTTNSIITSATPPFGKITTDIQANIKLLTSLFSKTTISTNIPKKPISSNPSTKTTQRLSTTTTSLPTSLLKTLGFESRLTSPETFKETTTLSKRTTNQNQHRTTIGRSTYISESSTDVKRIPSTEQSRRTTKLEIRLSTASTRSQISNKRILSKTSQPARQSSTSSIPLRTSKFLIRSTKRTRTAISHSTKMGTENPNRITHISYPIHSQSSMNSLDLGSTKEPVVRIFMIITF